MGNYLNTLWPFQTYVYDITCLCISYVLDMYKIIAGSVACMHLSLAYLFVIHLETFIRYFHYQQSICCVFRITLRVLWHLVTLPSQPLLYYWCLWWMINSHSSYDVPSYIALSVSFTRTISANHKSSLLFYLQALKLIRSQV